MTDARREAPQAAIEERETRIEELETEIARLRQVEAAAQEARAVLDGRRPGMGIGYAAELLRAALNKYGEKPPLPIVKGGGNARRRKPAG